MLGLIAAVLLLAACGPTDEQVTNDFTQLVAAVPVSAIDAIVTFVASGEGDSSTVYKHVRFDLVAKQDLRMTGGILTGLTMNEWDKVCNGEVVVMYRKEEHGQWQPKAAHLNRSPSKEC